jgi:putative membrane protein
MKQVINNIEKWILTGAFLFALSPCFCQTSKDTVKTGRANDQMNVNPGRVNDGMAVTPSNPHDGMSVMSDTSFLSKNIMDNRQEIALSKLGQAKGTSAAVKKVAAMMITDHTAILNDLVKLAARKQGSGDTNGSEMPMPSLNPTEGATFDATWATEMLTMHESKIAELESFLSLTKDAELKAAVMRAIPKIKAHRDLLLKIPGAKGKGKTQTI